MVDSIYGRMGLDVAEVAMRLLRKRQEFIASNIANADTPGYKALRFKFEDELQRAVYGGEDIPLYCTHPRHICDVKSLDEVDGHVLRQLYPVRNDENSVDIDKEMALLAQTQLTYNAITQAYSMQIAKLKYAISGGRR